MLILTHEESKLSSIIDDINIARKKSATRARRNIIASLLTARGLYMVSKGKVYTGVINDSLTSCDLISIIEDISSIIESNDVFDIDLDSRLDECMATFYSVVTGHIEPGSIGDYKFAKLSY